MEHTDDESEAEQIALDHLKEDPSYYTKLLSAGIQGEDPVLDMRKFNTKQSTVEETPENPIVDSGNDEMCGCCLTSPCICKVDEVKNEAPQGISPEMTEKHFRWTQPEVPTKKMK